MKIPTAILIALTIQIIIALSVAWFFTIKGGKKMETIEKMVIIQPGETVDIYDCTIYEGGQGDDKFRKYMVKNIRCEDCGEQLEEIIERIYCF